MVTKLTVDIVSVSDKYSVYVYIYVSIYRYVRMCIYLSNVREERGNRRKGRNSAYAYDPYKPSVKL